MTGFFAFSNRLSPGWFFYGAGDGPDGANRVPLLGASYWASNEDLKDQLEGALPFFCLPYHIKTLRSRDLGCKGK